MNAPRFFQMVTIAVSVFPLAASQAGAWQPKLPPAVPQVVAVTVNGEPLYVSELETSFEGIAQKQRISPDRVDKAKADLLWQLVKRRLVIQALERDEALVTPEEIDNQMQQLAAKAKQQQLTVEQLAELRGISVETIRKDIYWQLAWERYQERHLVDALEDYFNHHKKDLDGTEVRASHILLRPQRYNETETQTQARAQRIREAILAGKISFEDAARRFSMGPSREQDGDLGFLPRRGVMLEDFSKAAFKLDVGELSEPVSTAFGTHLIRVTEIKPGSRQWTEVIPQIKMQAAVDLFDDMAAKEQENADIQYTGATPYLKLGTEELVLPDTNSAAAK